VPEGDRDAIDPLVGSPPVMSAPSTDPRTEGSGRGWKLYVAGALTVLAIIFIVQNSQQTTVKFLFAETEMPLFFALVASIVLGAIIGWLAPRVRGGQRRRD
jgi:uncharacterized integral membrane protein